MYSRKNDTFIEHLQHVAGGPWTIFDAQRELDKLVVQPLPLSMDSPWADSALFLDFLTSISHRRLIQCFLGSQAIREWTFEALQKQTRPQSPQALLEALEQCCFWQIALEEKAMNMWRGHPRMETFNNSGWTFEWIVQMLLEREYHAQVRRHVILGEIAALGEIDVLAFLDGRSLLVECKSSSKGLTDRQLDRFVAKGRGFPSDRTLLLIDTDDAHQMQQRAGQLGQSMQRAFNDASVGAVQTYGGSSIVWLRENLYVADTAGGITTTLQAVLDGTKGPSVEF